jgi:hypothetical protein
MQTAENQKGKLQEELFLFKICFTSVTRNLQGAEEV